MALIAVVEAYKVWKCGCYVPTWDKRTIIPCQKHTGPGAPAGTALLQNQRLYRMSKKSASRKQKVRS